jgi:hypothetical protein
VTERLVDMAAIAWGLDPFETRRRDHGTEDRHLFPRLAKRRPVRTAGMTGTLDLFRLLASDPGSEAALRSREDLGLKA